MKKVRYIIPFWLMNFDELMYFLVGAKSSDDQKPEYRRFREIITQAKKMNCHLKAGDVNPNLYNCGFTNTF